MMKDKIIREVYDTLVDRKENPIDSYTSKLMQDSDKRAEDKILEKLGEEATEVILASKNNEDLVHESADLIFFTILNLAYKGIPIDDLFDELENRHK
ncbi:MAG: phosphoribosyl-ATP diphosphatase [Methanosphaera sp.]|nr:phosphoribosyl-ATP diphosphatase [Methanosphaera sp.]